MLPQFIGANGLSEFEFDFSGFSNYKAKIDMSAMRDILAETCELRKLSISNAAKIHSESLGELINMISDLIRCQPQRLTELDFANIGGSAEQGS